MLTYVPLRRHRGDWRNDRKGTRVACKRCGYEFATFIPLIAARCPEGHPMHALVDVLPRRKMKGRKAA